MQRKYSLVKDIFFYLIPSISITVFVLFCIFGQMTPTFPSSSIADGLFEVLAEMGDGMFEGFFDNGVFLGIVLGIVMLIICSPFIVIAIGLACIAVPLWSLVLFAIIPYHFITGSGFYLDNWVLWFFIVSVVLLIVSLLVHPIFDYSETYTSTTGRKIIRIEGKTATISDEKEELGGEFNFWIFLGNLFLTAFGGWVVFIIHRVKDCNN